MAKPKRVAKKATKEVKLGAKKVKKSEFSVEVHVHEEIFKSEADSVAQAITEIVSNPSFPYPIKSRVILKVNKGELKGQRTLRVAVARRLFNIITKKPDSLDLIVGKLTNSLA